MFREASQSRVFEDVVNQIQEAILKGSLETGDVLPAERDLRGMFHTSRGTLREALRVLEERGLIEIKLGVRGGAVVKGITAERATESLALLIRSRQVSLKHLAEFREGLEGSVAALAARRAAEDDLRILQELVDEAGQCIDRKPLDRDAFIDVDRRFHLALAEISRNPVYVFVFHSVHDNIQRYYDRFLPMHRREILENYRDLCDILEAVGNKDAKSARMLVQNHVLRFHRHMQTHEATADQPESKAMERGN